MNTVLYSNQKVFRLDDIRLYQFLGSIPEASFEDIIRLAKQISQAPIAFISFIDASQHWLKAHSGLERDIQTYLDFCNLALTQREFSKSVESQHPTHPPTQIHSFRDLCQDPRFNHHSLVNQGKGIRFYIGIPITTPEGTLIGMLSLMDYIPRQLTQDTIEGLKSLTRQILNLIDLRRQVVHLGGKILRLEDIINERKQIWELVQKERDFFCTVLDTVDALVIVLDTEGKIVRFNHTCEKLTGYLATEVEDTSFWDLFLLPEEIYEFKQKFAEFLEENHPSENGFHNEYESYCVNKDHVRRLIAWSNQGIRTQKGELKYIICTGIDITESRKNELEIREARQFLNSIVENIPHAIFVKYADSLRFATVNKALEKLTGYSKEDLVGHTDYELFPPEQAEFFTQTDRTVLVQGEMLDIGEENITTKPGEIRTLHTKKIPIINPEGFPQYLLGISEDITERKQAQETLHLLERAIIASSNGIVITDNLQPDHPIIYCNPAFEKITGYSQAEVIGKNCRLLQNSDSEQKERLTIRQAIQEERECLVVIKNYRKDGTPFWNELAIAPVRDSQGKLTHFIGIQTDITSRREAEEALRTSEERYRLLAENATDLISRHTPEGLYLYASPACQILLGYEPEELIGHSVYDFCHPDDVKRLEELHQNCRLSTDIYTISYRIRQQKGDYIWFETTAHKIQESPSGKVKEIMAISRDVTDRKQVESSLVERSHLSMLEAKVGVALGEGGNLRTLLQRCTEAIEEHLQAESVAIWTLNNEQEKLELEAYTGESLKDYQPALNLTDFTPIFSSENQRIESPLIVENHPIGVMVIQSKNKLTEAATEALGWVKNAIAVAIDRVKAREELLSRREGLLFRLASQIRDSLDLDKILGTAVNEIYSLLQVDQCLFLWYLPGQPMGYFAITHEAKNPDLNNLIDDYPPEEVVFLAEQVQNHETLQIDDLENTENLDESTHKFLQRKGITAKLMLPLQTHAGQLGAVVCNHYSQIRPWSHSEVELLKAVVDQVAIAIDQAELYAQTRAAALAAQTQAFQLREALQNLQQKEAQLIQSEKMSSLGQMVAGVAHEINNPVNFIYGNLNYCGDYVTDILELLKLYQEYYPHPVPPVAEKADEIDLDFIIEDLPKILSSMEMGAERIRQIVLSLRNFSRLDEAEMKPVDVHEGIDNTLLILQNRLKLKGKDTGIEIVKNYSKLPKINCYAGQLNQVFMNIIANSIDALENQPEPRIITIQTECISDSSGQAQGVRIRLCDNGPGMTPETKNRLFDPFFTTKPVGKGTGLGLSISYQIIVEKHGGSIECTSEPGQGSEFCIDIPLRTYDQDPQESLDDDDDDDDDE